MRKTAERRPYRARGQKLQPRLQHQAGSGRLLRNDKHQNAG